MARSSAPKSFISNLKPNDDNTDVVFKSGSSTKTWKVHKQVLLITSGRLFDIANSNPSIVLQNAEDSSFDLLVDYMYGRDVQQRLYYPLGERTRAYGNDMLIRAAVRRYTSLHRVVEIFDIRELRTLVRRAFQYWFQSEPLSCDLVKSVLDATFARGYILSKEMKQLVFKSALKMLLEPAKWNTRAWDVMKAQSQYRVFTRSMHKALNKENKHTADPAIEYVGEDEHKRQGYDGGDEYSGAAP